MQEIQFQSLGEKIPWKRKLVTPYSFLAWEIPWREEPGELQSVGSQKSWIGLSD